MKHDLTTWAIYILGVADGVITVRYHLTLFPSIAITLIGTAIASAVHLWETSK
jgi:hypothetical protein